MSRQGDFPISTSPVKHQIKVLLIDDQALIGEAIRRMLASESDIVFHHCIEPTQAIQQAVEISPTVILQDLVMPDIDGLLLLRFFRANPTTRNIPMIVLSAKEEAELKAAAFAAGANDYLVKLPEPIELIARIRYHSQAYINRLQRDEAYLALQESEQRLRAVLENMPVMLTAVDDNGKIIVWNRECERVTGYQAAEIVGKENPAQTGGAFVCSLQASQGQRREHETEITCKDGSTKTIEWLNISNRFPVPGWASWGIGVDVTKHKQAETTLEKARAAAIEAARLKSQFLANMSHEIRTPMNGVIGMVGLLLQSDLNPKQREYAQTIRTSANHLLNLLNDILDFSKLEAGEMRLESLDFDLEQCVNEVLSLLIPQAQEKGLKLFASFEHNCPKLLQGDPGRLRQILLNLVGNAIKFTTTGYVKIQVKLQSETQQIALIRFEVIDTGIGIPPEGIPKLFQSFSQVDASTSRQYGGTGLGLAICQELVSLMGGEIGVESVVNQGSNFWFTVELHKQVISQTIASTQQVEKVPDLVRLPQQLTLPNSLKILVAEDNSINQAVILSQLEMLSYQADCAVNGLEALEYLAKQDYDLVLMDCQMPIMDGYQATQELRRREGNQRHTIVIALTANAMLADREKCLAAGMDDYLCKPIEPEDLVAVIQRWTQVAFPDTSPPAPEATPLPPIPRGDPESPPALLHPSLIDFNRLQKISRGKAGTQQRLLQIFLETTTKDLQALEGAIQASDYHQVQHYAHRLKGSAANVGINQLSALAKELEGMAQQQTLTGATQMLASLWQTLGQVRALVYS